MSPLLWGYQAETIHQKHPMISEELFDYKYASRTA
jgi:hypothetical protein